jgi:poly(ADP-ribose) glycohydrolase ARH3
MQRALELVRRLVLGEVAPLKAAEQLGRGVAVQRSLPFALYAFLRHPKSFEACLFCAILHGGDQDTLGAMACAVSGAYLGVEGIPQSWLDKLENRTLIEYLAFTLAAKHAGHSDRKLSLS